MALGRGVQPEGERCWAAVTTHTGVTGAAVGEFTSGGEGVAFKYSCIISGTRLLESLITSDIRSVL